MSKRQNTDNSPLPKAVLRTIKAGVVCAGAIFLNACDGPARDAFYKFCDEHRGFLPEQTIEIDGAEFRGYFFYRSLPGPGAWFRYASYYEFSPTNITGDAGNYNDEGKYVYYDIAKRNQNLGLSASSVYRVREYGRASSECELFYRFAYLDGETPSQIDLTNNARFSSYLSQDQCIGMQKSNEFLSDYLVEATHDPVVGHVLFRPISELKITVTQKSSKETVAVLREFEMEPRMFLFLTIGNEKTGVYRCNSSSRIGEELSWDVLPVRTALSHVFQ